MSKDAQGLPVQVSRRWLLIGTGASGLALLGGMWLSRADRQTAMTIYRSATCACCAAWVTYIEKAGFLAQVIILDDEALAANKRALGVPDTLASCHTAVSGNYVLEGHVPVPAILKLLDERPAGQGLAVPGMPSGSPGMEVPGQSADAFDVLLFQRDGTSAIFAHFSAGAL